jgi:hypothetical protein
MPGMRRGGRCAWLSTRANDATRPGSCAAAPPRTGCCCSPAVMACWPAPAWRARRIPLARIRRAAGAARLPPRRRRGRPAARPRQSSVRAGPSGRPGQRRRRGLAGLRRAVGFAETDRQIEQVRSVGAGPVAGRPPAGVHVVVLSDRPGLWSECYERFGRQVLGDFATRAALQVSREDWQAHWASEPMFLAPPGCRRPPQAPRMHWAAM